MAADETAELLAAAPGGQKLLDWFEGRPDFHDAEVLSLRLDREAHSTLTLAVFHARRPARVTFVLTDWIDVSLRGFSGQNLIGSLTLQRPEPRAVEPWELGVGCVPGEVQSVLAPCFGAYGAIRASLREVRLEEAAG